jgi:hypothetical protein
MLGVRFAGFHLNIEISEYPERNLSHCYPHWSSIYLYSPESICVGRPLSRHQISEILDLDFMMQADGLNGILANRICAVEIWSDSYAYERMPNRLLQLLRTAMLERVSLVITVGLFQQWLRFQPTIPGGP